VQQACCMRMDTVTRGSNCLELKQSGSGSFHANGHRYAWFPLFGVDTKWNKLVACQGTPLRVVPTVWSRKKVEQACCMRMNTVLPGSHCLELKRSEQAFCMRMDTVRRGSNCLEVKQSGSGSFHANGHRYAWFPLLGVETKWNKLVACE